MTLPPDLLGSMVITVPHMDDGVLGCGGMIAQLPDKTAVHVIYATDGRMSPVPVFPGRAQTDFDLCPVRMAEARSALACLGIPLENIHFLNFPDSHLQRHKSELAAALTDHLQRIQPDIVLTPFRYDRHPDHLALNRVMTDYFHKHPQDARLIEYFVYYRSRLLPGGDVRGYLPPDHLLIVDIDKVSDRKHAALACFTSQTTLFFDWQTRPNLTAQLLDEVSKAPEYFLPYRADYPGSSIFTRLALWVRLAHRLEPILKKRKDQALALMKGRFRG